MLRILAGTAGWLISWATPLRAGGGEVDQLSKNDQVLLLIVDAC